MRGPLCIEVNVSTKDSLRDLERERVRLAGCLLAAEGGITKFADCKNGGYGWSPAFEATKKLRQRMEKLEKVLKYLYSMALVPRLDRLSDSDIINMNHILTEKWWL
jgi:hypothetical protein